MANVLPVFKSISTLWNNNQRDKTKTQRSTLNEPSNIFIKFFLSLFIRGKKEWKWMIAAQIMHLLLSATAGTFMIVSMQFVVVLCLTVMSHQSLPTTLPHHLYPDSRVARTKQGFLQVLLALF